MGGIKDLAEKYQEGSYQKVYPATPCVKDQKIGFFKIPYDAFLDIDTIRTLQEFIQKNVIVVNSLDLTYEGNYSFLAYSGLFDRIEIGEAVPRYVLEISPDQVRFLKTDVPTHTLYDGFKSGMKHPTEDV